MSEEIDVEIDDGVDEIISFFVVDDDGFVIKTGTCQRSMLHRNGEGGEIHIGSAPAGRVRFVDGEFIEVETTVPYEDLRLREYPSIGDQLDSLWHAMDQGALPRVEPFYGDIKRVKDAHPKPTGN